MTRTYSDDDGYARRASQRRRPVEESTERDVNHYGDYAPRRDDYRDGSADRYDRPADQAELYDRGGDYGDRRRRPTTRRPLYAEEYEDYPSRRQGHTDDQDAPGGDYRSTYRGDHRNGYGDQSTGYGDPRETSTTRRPLFADEQDGYADPGATSTVRRPLFADERDDAGQRATGGGGDDTQNDLLDGDGQPPEGPRGRKGGRRRLRRVLLVVLLTILGLGVAGVVAFVIGYIRTPIPDPNTLLNANTTTLYYGDGKSVLGTFHSQNRISVPLDQVPKRVQDAVVAAENRSFWTDTGISPSGIARAAWNQFRGGSTQGGSTITQQYVKNYYLTQDQTLTRKVKELFITLKLQGQVSKQEVLQNYLNTSYYGRGAWGIEVAANAYFDKHVQQLTPQEAAVLASVLRAPSNYDPAVDPSNESRLAGRYHYVLEGMAEMGEFPRAEAATAPLPKLHVAKTSDTYAGPGGYLLVQVRKELLKLGYSEQQIESGGLQVTTTYDAKAQKAMEKAFAENFPTENAAGVYAGAAAVQPGTGAVVAMYGGKDYLKRQFNDATQAKLQPGSTFKPFALAAALEHGVSLESRFAGNSPLELPDGDEVSNEFDRDYGRTVDLLKATRDSINTAYVDMTEHAISPNDVYDAAVRAGVPKDSPGLDKHAKISLGFASVSPTDMANSYATFATGGVSAQWHVVDKVTSSSGEITYQAKSSKKQEFRGDVIRDVDYALQDVVEHGSAEEAAKDLGRPAAGKTGTHEDQTAWFVGYTPQLAASVAFYKDANGDGVKESLDDVGGMDTFFGGGYPAQIWTSFMKNALAGQPVKQFPPPSHIGRSKKPTPTNSATRRNPVPSVTPTTAVPDPTLTPRAPESPNPTPTFTHRSDPTLPPKQPKPPKSPDPTPTFTQEPPDPTPTFTPRKPLPGPTNTKWPRP
ncbi:transglycosylase domain-containing protein [Actinopolymorpha pittospori]|uniref:Membrane peptidoglycan carboxypeptidase n=1 Tax=Actinopolymorpha pittospori TaxID=648752 RepID=A0A927MQE7_9ACTN|nr:membrane peptidoglycan carboxypeptidase [Actinopolymorpha pittospori]